MKLLPSSAVAAACLAPLASSLATYAPISSGPSYSVGIPPNSPISTSSQGGIYFSLSAPTSYQWVGLGIGKQMAGATIFVMYADGNGNVTISGRDGGQGHVEPELDSALMAGVTLLEGSGVNGSIMTANVHCKYPQFGLDQSYFFVMFKDIGTTCTLSSTSNSASSPWIAAWHSGAALNTNDAGTDIDQHGNDDYRQFTLDLTKASLSADSNPFIVAASSSSSPSNSSPASPSSSSGSASDDSSSSTTESNESRNERVDKAHGVIMGLVVVILFPAGAILMRTVRHPWIHAGVQILSLALLIAGLALGVKLAQYTDQLWGNTHTELGVAIVALFLLQPFLGLAHHFLYQKHSSRTPVSHIHIWYGRILMILAVINGGLGLQLAANTRSGEIVYGVLAGVMAVVYVVIVVLRRQGPGIGRMGRGRRR
ncbi:Cytochrome b561 and DOMON domain-containing protein, partial [Lachnellula subtilissima]